MSLGSFSVIGRKQTRKPSGQKVFDNCNLTFIVSGAKHLKKINFFAFVFYLAQTKQKLFLLVIEHEK